MTVINATRGASKKYVDEKLAAEASDKQGKIDALNAKVGSVTVSGNTVTKDYGTVTNQVLTDSKAYTDAQVDSEESTRANADAGIIALIAANNAEIVNDRYSYGPVTQQVLDDANGYTDAQISQRVTQVYSIQGTCTYAQLIQLKNLTGDNKLTINEKLYGVPEIGNIWNVRTPNTDDLGNEYTQGDPEYIPPGTNYVWTGTDWDAMGGTIDLSTYETTSAVNTKLAQYAKATKTNEILAQHQNLIKKTQVSLTSSGFNVNGTTVNATGVTGNSSEVLIVSPIPAHIEKATNYGIYASASTQGSITFKADAAIASGDTVTFDITIIDTSAGVQIPMSNGNVDYS